MRYLMANMGRLIEEMTAEGTQKTEHHYEVILHWSNEDQAYIAEVGELEWCVADGATYQEAIANIEVEIDEWIETAKGKGWKIPEPKGRRLLYA